MTTAPAPAQEWAWGKRVYPSNTTTMDFGGQEGPNALHVYAELAPTGHARVCVTSRKWTDGIEQTFTPVAIAETLEVKLEDVDRSTLLWAVNLRKPGMETLKRARSGWIR